MSLILALLLSMASDSPATGALELARSGKLQCHSPDIARRRCRAIAGYAFSDDGEIINFSEVMLNASPLLVMRAEDPVTFRNGAICGVAGDPAVATFTVDGEPAAPEVASEVARQLHAAWQIIGLGQEFCTYYVPDGEQLTAIVTVGGVERPELSQTVLWIDAGEGYEVGP